MYPQVFGKYVLERELSRGGMARVLLATLRGAGGFEKKLVVKQIRDELAYDQQFVRRFVEEAKTTVALSHPNIVPVYELGVEQGTYFLAMELVEGVSVAELVRERNVDGSRRVLTPEEGAYLGVEVCRALDYAHRRMKVVHRDITPRNVMIDEEGQIKLIDFGIAAPALVSGQEILGSPGHMAPEQVDGGELGPATDIFAVAVLLMEAWTGVAPFRRATPEECSAAIREKHPRPSDHDPRLIPIDDPIVRAMSIDPHARQQQASDLARSLRTFLQGVDVADIARGLGERVHDLRESVDSPAPASRAPGTPRASSGSHGELGTKTFAARADPLSWSNAPAAPEPDLDEDIPASTRRLDSDARVPLDRTEPSTRAMGAPAAASVEASMPTPLLVDLDELAQIHEQIAAQRSTRPGGQVDVPTVRRRSMSRPTDTGPARPLEAAVRSSSGSPKAGRARPMPLVALVALVALLAGLGIMIWKTRGEPLVADGPSPRVTPSSSPGPAVSAPGPVATPADPRPPDVAPPPTNVSPSTSVKAEPPVSVAPAGKSTVVLLGDPGTRVSIDGASRGSCPLRLTLEPGRHEVRFTFEPTGESRGETFNVKIGEQVTVRADFTGASPTVKIQR